MSDTARASDESPKGAEVKNSPESRRAEPEELEPVKLRKLFIGGVSWDTTDGRVQIWLEAVVFGPVEEALIMRERQTGASRGFGFVTFKTAAAAQAVLDGDVELDGRRVDPKLAVPRDEIGIEANQQQVLGNRKIFVGGVDPDITQAEFEDYFGQFGKLIEAVVMMGQDGRNRGFGFVRYRNDRIVDDIVAQTHSIAGKPIDCRIATPRRNERDPSRSKPRSSAGYDDRSAPRSISGGYGRERVERSYNAGRHHDPYGYRGAPSMYPAPDYYNYTAAGPPAPPTRAAPYDPQPYYPSSYDQWSTYPTQQPPAQYYDNAAHYAYEPAAMSYGAPARAAPSTYTPVAPSRRAAEPPRAYDPAYSRY